MVETWEMSGNHGMLSAMQPVAPISVIIPAFNPGRFLAEALASVQAQTVHPLEVLLVDDGSEPPIAIPPAISLPIRLIRQANAGQAAARNLGMKEAKGEWLAFLDADDVWHPEKLARQWDVAREVPTSTIIGCRAVLIDAGGNFIGTGPGAMSGRTTTLSREEFVRNAPLALLVPSMAMVRNAAAVTEPGFDTRFQPIEDLVFFDELLSDSQTRCAIVERALLKRRIHGASLTLRYREMHRSYLAWAHHAVSGNLEASVATDMQATARFVTAMSALHHDAFSEARQLLKQAIRVRPRPAMLMFFALTFFPSGAIRLLRRCKQASASAHAGNLWKGKARDTST